MIEELRKYIKENLEIKKERKLFKNILSKECACGALFEDSHNIDDFIKNNHDQNDFQKVLFNLIDERDLKDSDVYNKVHLDRRLFSKIRNDNNYHPSKETVILLGLSLELDEKEIEKLLESASYSLPKNNYYDLIIRFCFINKIYKLKEVNELLDSYQCKLFNY